MSSDSLNPLIVWSNRLEPITPSQASVRLSRKDDSHRSTTSVTRSQLETEETPQVSNTLEEPALEDEPSNEEVREDENPFFADLGISCSLFTIGPNQISSYKTESPDSLVSLLSRLCETSIGKRQMRFQLLNPFERKDDLEDRFKHIEFFKENYELIDLLKPIIRRVLSLKKVINRLSSAGHPYMIDWRTIVHTLGAIDDLRGVLMTDPSLAFCKDVIESVFHPEIDTFRINLERAFDIEDSIATGKFIIKPGFCAEIDLLRSHMQGLEAYLEQAALSIRELWKRRKLDPLTQYHIGYFEDVGFLLMIPLETDKLDEVASELDEIMSRPISTGPFLYYKNQYFDALDDHYHTPRGKIESLSWKIHEELREEFISLAETISLVIERIGTLDIVIAFASAAIQYNWKQPVITDNVFNITGGRHPVLSITTPNFVPNDYVGEKHLKIITGPNASGKSVYISQVALIVHLAMCGSFVPAETACIPMIKNILTVCKPVHTATNDTSLFLSDLKKLRYALEKCTDSSLILLDEFGKSTKPEDGTAALVSVIKYFLEMKPTPHVLIVTHFLSLHELLPTNHFNLQFLEFQAHQEQSDFRYSYSFSEGHAATSLSQAIYQFVGLDKSVAARAKEVEQILSKRGLLTATYDGLQEEQLKKAKQVIDKFLGVNHQSFNSILKFFSELKAIMKDHADS